MYAGGSHSAHGDVIGGSLLPLTPSYEEGEHGVYLRHLREALTGPDSDRIHNIAVTGGYGVGKSSVLQRLRDEFGDRVVVLSLPTLGESTPSADPHSPEGNAAGSVTNRIQKEIVKQLLYRERPERVPGSRYRRLTGFRWRGAIGSSLLAAATLVLVVYLTGSADRLVHLAGRGLFRHAAVYLALLVFFALVIVVFRRLSHNRFWIQQVGAGSATITLSSTAGSYFDECLDEIVYFFEAAECDIIVFEDLDRFDDPHIFETLRELNTILNNSRQLRGKNVRFIYAIKDSIFERLGQPPGEVADDAEAEVARANRTKFFDLVVPVVPFITHRSARDLMSRTLEMAGLPVSRDLVDLAARHVADMRLIKNITNEFTVFRQKLLLGERSLPGLAEDQLFAMILYKNIHLSDFELIRIGQSCLDTLYRHNRSIVTGNIRELNSRARQLDQELVVPGSVEERSERLGGRLEDHILQVIRYSHPNAGNVVTQMANQPGQPLDLRSVDFWNKFLQPGTELQACPNYMNNQPFRFTCARIGTALGEELSPARWQDGHREALRAELDGINDDKAMLAHAGMKDLFERARFTLSLEGVDRSLAEIARRTLGSQLACSLVEKGYIDGNFTLYVSQFHAVHLSVPAVNFIVHNVEPGVMDPHFRFSSSDDVQAVLRECGPSVLSDRSMYNIAVVDYLLEHRPGDADTVIGRLAGWGPDEQEFVRAYVDGGEKAANMIGRLAGFWPLTLSLVADGFDVGDEQRAELFSAAMLGTDPAALPGAAGRVTGYIEGRYEHLTALTCESSPSAAEQAVSILRHFGVTLATIRPLSAGIRDGVIKHGLYALSRENLIEATGGNSLALDALREASDHVYAHVMDNLTDYLSVVFAEPFPVTVGDPGQFAAILEDAARHDETSLPEIARHASPDCRVDDLQGIAGETWRALASAQRFPPTFANIAAYAAHFGIDDSLAVTLTADPKIQDHKAAAAPEKEALAIAILNAGAALSDPAVRVQLVLSLDLAGQIDVSRISPEEGQLAGLLVAEKIIADDAAAYDAIASLSWATREFLISRSASFTDYAIPSQLPPQDLPRLVASPLVTRTAKKALLARLPALAAGADRQALEPVALYAVRENLRLSSETLLLLAQAGVAGSIVVTLLAPVLPDTGSDALVTMLKAVGKPYELLTSPGRRPARLPGDPAHQALARHLTNAGHVSSYTSEDNGTTIKVNMKHL